MQKPHAAAVTLATLALYGVRRLGAWTRAQLLASLWRRPASVHPARVLFAPETVAEANPAVAADIYAGIFALAGEAVDVSGGSPFLVVAPSRAWARALHGFAWLHHLEANATELSSSNARALFDEWLHAAGHGASDDVASDLDVTATRLVNWLVQAPLLLNGADPLFRQRYYRALGRHIRRLEKALALLPRGSTRLGVAAALALAGTVVAGEVRLQRLALGALLDALADVLPDGGYASRSPEAVLDALGLLIPVREALVRRQQEVPAGLAEAIDRMLPMLRFFRHGDGTLAAFHGTGHVPAAAVDAVLAFDDVRGQPAANARYSGFQRIEAGRSALIMDTGRTPPPPFGRAAHAAALAFEFSHGAQRIIVNCGALERAKPEWAAAARATAAQSTLTVDDTASAKILERWPLDRVLGPMLYAGPRTVEVRREVLSVTASHDGYRAAFGLVHERTLALSEDGLFLEGDDRIAGADRAGALAYAIRFHIEPAVRVRLEKGHRRVVLTLPDGAIWLFGVELGPGLDIEDTIVLVGPRKARRAAQIVIAGNTRNDDTVRWHLSRHAAPLADAGGAPLPPNEA